MAPARSGALGPRLGVGRLPAVLAILFCSCISTAHGAFYGAEVVLTNGCSSTIDVVVDINSDNGDWTYSNSASISPGSSYTFTGCNLCAGGVFSCQPFTWSYSGEASLCGKTWSDSGSNEVCGFQFGFGGGFSEKRRLICEDGCTAPPPPPPDCDYGVDDYGGCIVPEPPSSCTCCEDYDISGCCEYGDSDYGSYRCSKPPEPCKCCENYGDYSDCCEYGDSDYGSDRCEAPPPPPPPDPSPVPVPVPVLVPASPLPPIVLTAPPPPPAVIPLPPPTTKPTTFETVDLTILGADAQNFDPEPVKIAVSTVAQVPKDWVDVEVIAGQTSRRRRQLLLNFGRALLQEEEVQVRAQIYTDNTKDLLTTLSNSINDQSMAKQINAAKPEWTLQAAIVQPSVSPPSPKSGSSTNIGAIVGGVLGGVAVLAAGASGFIVLQRKRKAQALDLTSQTSAVPEMTHQQADVTAVTTTRSIGAPPTKPAAASWGMVSSRSRSDGPPLRPPVDPFMSWISEQAAYRSSQGPAALQPHEIDFTRVQVIKPIGEGSFGRVYAAKYDGRDIAVKVLLDASGGRLNDPLAAEAALSSSSPVLQKLNQEVSLMSRLQHPNIVSFVGVCTVPPAIVTELCSRGSLSDVLKAADGSRTVSAELTWRRRLAMAIDAAEGLRYLHTQTPPLVHRDLKSPNMLVTQDWNVKISDFNLSKLLEEDSKRSSSLAAMNPRWLSPELFDGAQGSKACDVFAFAVVLWELMTLKFPWTNTNPWTIVAAIREGRRLEIPARDQVPGAVPTIQCYNAYVKLMNQCWAQKPEDRPDVAEISTSLRRIAAGNI